MFTKENELITKFKTLESELKQILKELSKIKGIKIEEEESNAATKKKIKDYIKLVDSANEILRQYCDVAEEIGKITGVSLEKKPSQEEVEKSEKMSKSVVGLRKDKPKQPAPETKSEAAALDAIKREVERQQEAQPALERHYEDSEEEYRDQIDVLNGKVLVSRHKKSGNKREY